MVKDFTSICRDSKLMYCLIGNSYGLKKTPAKKPKEHDPGYKPPRALNELIANQTEQYKTGLKIEREEPIYRA